MQPRNWFLATLAMIIGAAGVVMGLNFVVDLYGLYHPTQGRKLVVYGDSRVAKYLFSSRYVPENFNAVMIGPSVSANWNLTTIEKLRVYNDCINGGNIVEGKAMIDSAVSRPGISVAFLLVHPALTFSHDYKTVSLTPRLKYSSLGSVSLWEAYKNIVNIRLHRAQLMFDYAGTENFAAIPTRMNDDMERLWRAGDSFELDPVALAAYRDTVAELRAHHVQIVYVVPPTLESLLQRKRAAFEDYVRLIQAGGTAADKWIDLRSELPADFRNNPVYFPDGVHLIPEAAQQVVAYINSRVNDWIRQNQLTATR